MSSRLTSLFLSALAWVGFVVVVLWTIGFLAGVVVPRTVDGPARTTTGFAVAADLGLLGLFAVQHSVMARREVKSWLRRSDPRVARAHDVRPGHRRVPRRAAGPVAALGRPGLGRERRGSDRPVVRSAAPAGSWRSRRRSRSTTSSSRGCDRPGGQPPGTPLRSLRAADRRPLRRRTAPTADRNGPGLLGDPADERLAPSLRARSRPPTSLVGMRFEERDLRRSFGESYDAYSAHVPALLPWFPVRPRV